MLSSWSSWVDGFGNLNIVGDVLNRTSVRRDATIKARLLNAQGTQLGATKSVQPYSSPIAAGARSPFAYYAPAPAGYDHIQLSLDATNWTAGPMDGALRVIANAPRTDVGGDRHYTGTLRNDSPFGISEWIVSVGLYTSGGTLANTWHHYSDIGLEPGGSAPFEIILPDHYTGATTHLYQAEGISADYGKLAVSWDNYFDDIGATAFRGDVIWLAESDITHGCADGRFCPTSQLTRGQMAAFLDRALHLPTTATDFFTDDDDSIFEAAINRLAKSGITGGCAADRFCPASRLTRGQMAAFLDRGLDLPATATDFFTDDDDSIFETSINELAASGITGGCAPGRFCPDALVTRGQMAAFLRRALS